MVFIKEHLGAMRSEWYNLVNQRQTVRVRQADKSHFLYQNKTSINLIFV